MGAHRSSREPAVAIAPIAAAVVFAALGASDGVPWPGGDAPSATEVAEQVADADELYARERMEVYLEASERGEDREHITVRQEDVDAGLHDLDRLFAFGDALFEHVFRAEDGWGGQGATSGLSRVHAGTRGGRDGFSCAGCHSEGGPDGSGGTTQNAFVLGDGVRTSSALVRSPPHVLGLGPVQILGAEMSRLLSDLRVGALADAAAAGEDVTVTLVAKGVEFGVLTARPDGSVDTSGVVGVDPDLVVKPFGWKGDVAFLRRFVEEAARIHFGVQSHVLALGVRDDPDPDVAALGPGPWFDPDADGVQREIEEGLLTAGAVYLAMLEAPVVLPPHAPALRDRWARGSATFDDVGCASCHVRGLPLAGPTWVERPDTTEGDGVTINVRNDGEAPKVGPVVELFSDLKRHDMGPELADAFVGPTGVPASEFLTRPLWGLAETAPFLHDGRAATIEEAIVLHGGEASASRDAYAALDEEAQRDLQVFLLSLTRAPRVRIAR